MKRIAKCTHLADLTILNPETNIFDNLATISDSDEGYFGKIHGFTNSTAWKYAWDYECEFVPFEFEVAFDANGGTGSMETGTIQPDPYYTLPENLFTAAKGYRFIGWEYNGKRYQSGDKIIITENTTLKALWLKDGEFVSGDLNGDDTVTIADAVFLARFVSEDTTLTEKEIDKILIAKPDYDDDGLVTILDVKAFLKRLGKA